MNEIIKPIQNEEFYQGLLEELKAILTERGYNSRVELIQGKWEIGRRIVEDEKMFKRFGYGERIVETISQDLGTSARNIWQCVQFFRKFPYEKFDEIMEHLPEGKAIAWWKIRDKILPECPIVEKREMDKLLKQKTCKHLNFVCKDCKGEFSITEIKNMPE